MDAAMTVRGLAEVAGVSASTVSRIESGQVDPTVGMLHRLLEAAGLEMELTTHEQPGARIAALVDAWRSEPRGTVIDWTRLRAFLDHLALHPEATAAALRHAPRPSGSELLDNILAAVAETQCDDHGLPRPSWTSRVPALHHPWVTPGTPRIQDEARATTPPAFSARGLTLARSGLWRERSRAEH
jgi:transcriptional regulator with XRE-family HTH domain